MQPLRRYFPKSLYARVVLIVVLPIFLILAVVTYIFFERHWDGCPESLDQCRGTDCARHAPLRTGA